MASKVEKIREQQKKRKEELDKRKKEQEKIMPSVNADTTDFADDLVTAIANGELNDAAEPESILDSESEPEPESIPVAEPEPILDSEPESEPEPIKEAPKKKAAKECPASTKPAEKEDSANNSLQKEEEPRSLSNMLIFQAKPEAKSVHRSITIRPTSAKLADKILKEHCNGLSFNDLIQQLLDIWLDENRKHYNI